MQNLIILDLSSAVLMVVLAHLSMRLGAALKIRSYYRLFHAAAALVLVAALMNVLAANLPQVNVAIHQTVPMVLRFVAGCFAVGTALRYWRWVFSEYLKH